MHPILEELKIPKNFHNTVHLQDYFNYKSTQLGNMHKMRIYLFTELMSKLIADKTIVNLNSAIDVGCNTGLYSKIISEFGFKEVLGIDIEDAFVDRANKNFGFVAGDSSLIYKVQNAEEIDTSKKYDFILCTEVIEHTNKQKKTIENINQILNSGGVAIITMPNVCSLPYLLTWLSYTIQRRKFSREMKDHLRYPFFKTIKLFKNKPYKLIATTGTNLFYWHFLHYIPGFNYLNLLNFKLGKVWPFKFFTQYFYVVLKN